MALEKTIEFYNGVDSNFLRIRFIEPKSLQIVIAQDNGEEYPEDSGEEMMRFTIETKEDFISVIKEFTRVASEVWGFDRKEEINLA